MVYLPIVAEPFNQTTARYLTASYVLALTVVGLLMIIAQIAVQEVLHRQRDDAMVINLAGRQRMLSQELVKAALAWDVAADITARVVRQAEIDRVVREWTAANARLLGDDHTPGMGTDNPPEVAEALAVLQPAILNMVGDVVGLDQQMTSHLRPAVIARLLGSEDDFLPRMDTIVHMYQDAAAQRVGKLITLEFVLCAILLLVLAAEAFLVFRPTVRHLKNALGEREKLRDQEQENRELMVAAEVARGIGFDLHDGLGQTLTALSLQARAIEDNLHGQMPAGVAAQIAGLRAGLKETLVQTRAAARRLSPIDLQASGLEAALHELADSSQQVSGLRIRVNCKAGLNTGAAADDLFHIAQEAITNAIRHAHGRNVEVILGSDPAAQSPGNLRLEISDDGEGSTAPTNENGVGLRSMRYRARRLGGWLVCGPRIPHGWSVILTMPITAQGHHGVQAAAQASAPIPANAPGAMQAAGTTRASAMPVHGAAPATKPLPGIATAPAGIPPLPTRAPTQASGQLPAMPATAQMPAMPPIARQAPGPEQNPPGPARPAKA